MVRPWVVAGALIATGSVASALQVQPVEIAFSAGSVTLSAADAPVADVLAAWARTGHADVTGAEYLGARRISIHLTNANEAGALQAIVGSPGWYATVLRESPAASESIFQRIVILPAATAAANPSAAPEPEKLYSYDSDPQADGRAAALSALAPAPGVARRPADVEPESFYQYDAVAGASDLAGNSSGQGTATSQPLPQADVPEAIYSYSPTPQPREPVVASAVIPPTPALVPEAVFTYDATPDAPADTFRAGLVIPNLRLFDGWVGLRLPGRVIRYVSER